MRVQNGRLWLLLLLPSVRLPRRKLRERREMVEPPIEDHGDKREGEDRRG